MNEAPLPGSGTRETVGDTLILFTILALVLGLVGNDGAVLLASVPMLICGLLLRRGRPTASLLSIRIQVPKHAVSSQVRRSPQQQRVPVEH